MMICSLITNRDQTDCNCTVNLTGNMVKQDSSASYVEIIKPSKINLLCSAIKLLILLNVHSLFLEVVRQLINNRSGVWSKGLGRTTPHRKMRILLSVIGALNVHTFMLHIETCSRPWNLQPKALHLLFIMTVVGIKTSSTNKCRPNSTGDIWKRCCFGMCPVGRLDGHLLCRCPQQVKK